MMADLDDVPSGILERLRGVCRSLPEVCEERAWVGVRWRVRRHTFAHVLTIEAGHPQAYAEAAGTDGPLTVLTFRSPPEELAALTNAGPPFFKPRWFADIVGMSLDDHTGWPEVAELVTESYCLLAPRKLSEQVTRPARADPRIRG